MTLTSLQIGTKKQQLLKRVLKASRRDLIGDGTVADAISHQKNKKIVGK